MKSAIFFVLLAFVYLVQSNSDAGASSSDNLIDDSSSSNKSPRVVNQPSNELIDPENKSPMPSNQALKLMLLPTLTFIVTTVLKSKLVVAHMLFGAVVGAIATVAACYYTPVCSIAIGSDQWPAERMMGLMSPENLSTLSTLVNDAVNTYEAVRTLNESA